MSKFPISPLSCFIFTTSLALLSTATIAQTPKPLPIPSLNQNNVVVDQTELNHSPIKTQLEYAAPCEAISPESKLLTQLQKQIEINPSKNKEILDKFWAKIDKSGTPIIETLNDQQSRIIFLWKGAKHNVRLIGGPSNDHEWLTRMPKSDVWFKESIIDNRYIGSYSFAVDLPNLEGYLSNYCPHLNPNLKESRSQRRTVIQVQRIDPFNNNAYLAKNNNSGLRNENLVALKLAPKFINPKKYPDVAQPSLIKHQLESKLLNNVRTISIYQSKAKLNQDYITAIFFDGQHYNELLNVPKALDILVEQGKLPPIQAIFVSPPNEQIRPKELTPNKEFSAFFNQELMPWIKKNAPQTLNANKTVLLGSSLGGLSSAYLALENPNMISHVVPLSGSFWWQAENSDLPNGMSKIIREKNLHSAQHWFITANSYETSRNNNELSILETSPVVAEDLKQKGHDVTYKSYIGGHSYAVWQVAIQDALQHFFSKSL